MKYKNIFLMTSIIITFSQHLYAEEQIYENNNEIVKCIQEISEIFMIKPSRENAGAFLSHFRVLRENPRQSIPAIIKKIIDPNEDVGVKLEFSKMAYLFIGENQIMIEAKPLIKSLKQEQNKELKKLLWLFGKYCTAVSVLRKR